MNKFIIASRVFGIHILLGIEILDHASNLSAIASSIKMCNWRDAAITIEQLSP